MPCFFPDTPSPTACNEQRDKRRLLSAFVLDTLSLTKPKSGGVGFEENGVYVQILSDVMFHLAV